MITKHAYQPTDNDEENDAPELFLDGSHFNNVLRSDCSLAWLIPALPTSQPDDDAADPIRANVRNDKELPIATLSKRLALDETRVNDVELVGFTTLLKTKPEPTGTC